MIFYADGEDDDDHEEAGYEDHSGDDDGDHDNGGDDDVTIDRNMIML